MINVYCIWKVKEGTIKNEEDLTFIAPGSFSFTKNEKDIIMFDFIYYSIYIETVGKDFYINAHLENLENDYIKENLIDNNIIVNTNDFTLDLFKDGKIDLINQKNEMFCTIDINEEEVNNYLDVLEPKYLEVYDSITNEKVILINTLDNKESEHFLKQEVM